MDAEPTDRLVVSYSAGSGVMILLFGLALALFSVLGLASLGRVMHKGTGTVVLAAAGCTGFLALGLLVVWFAVTRLRRRTPMYVVDEDGITICRGWGLIRWDEIDEVRLVGGTVEIRVLDRNPSRSHLRGWWRRILHSPWRGWFSLDFKHLTPEAREFWRDVARRGRCPVWKEGFFEDDDID